MNSHFVCVPYLAAKNRFDCSIFDSTSHYITKPQFKSIDSDTSPTFLAYIHVFFQREYYVILKNENSNSIFQPKPLSRKMRKFDPTPLLHVKHHDSLFGII
ncbi:hypothetical protein ACF0H5_021798 [Mactra antiquata]